MLFDFKKAFVGGLSLLTAVQGRPTQPRDGGNSSSLQSTSSALPTPDAVQVFPTKGNTVNRQSGLVKKQSGSSINPADLSGSLKDLQTQPFPGRPGWELVTDRPATAQDGVISAKGLSGTEGPPEVDGRWKTKLGFGGGSAILLDNYDLNTTYATGYHDAEGLPPNGNVACFVLGGTSACAQDVIIVTSSGSPPSPSSPTTQGPGTTITLTSTIPAGEATPLATGASSGTSTPGGPAASSATNAALAGEPNPSNSDLKGLGFLALGPILYGMGWSAYKGLECLKSARGSETGSSVGRHEMGRWSTDEGSSESIEPPRSPVGSPRISPESRRVSRVSRGR
jgi:hypothetical protein